MNILPKAAPSPPKMGRALITPSEPAGNDGYDNINNDLILHMNEQIPSPDDRIFIIKRKLGSGQFGHVYKIQQMGTDKMFAMKISRSDINAQQNLKYEAEALEFIHTVLPPEARASIIHFECYFTYRNHVILITEVLASPLLHILVERKYAGLQFDLIQSVLLDVLVALANIHSIGLVHCDVKPENILQVSITSKNVKLIDFGCCAQIDSEYDTLQTPFYRAPEILLKLPFDTKIDIWSLGCVAAELMLGLPIFCGDHDPNLIYLINLRRGPFPHHMIEESPVAELYFDENGILKSEEELQRTQGTEFNSQQQLFIHRTIESIVANYPFPTGAKQEFIDKSIEDRKVFCDLLVKMLEIDPEKRISAAEALEHPFMKIKF